MLKALPSLAESLSEIVGVRVKSSFTAFIIRLRRAILNVFFNGEVALRKVVKSHS
jgi:hypothetical protein